MKIVIFKGGLGNQMFQYVFSNYLSRNYHENIYGYYGNSGFKDHNGLEINDCFKNVNLPHEGILSNLLVLIYKIKRKIFHLSSNTFDKFDKNDIVYDGYWQDINFFTFPINELFQFKDDINDKNQSLLKTIRESNSISVHIRRGDYLSKHETIYGNVCTIEYYSRAIEYVKSRIKGPQFIFFSDDINWVKNNFKDINYIYVDWNKGADSYIDMLLMSECKHNIIANSTFSWWGAYLNSNKDKIVISPKKWFNTEINKIDIIPASWIKI